MPAFWQLVWDQGVHVLTLLSAIDAQECRMFWPAVSGQHVFFDAGYQKMKVTLLDEVEAATDAGPRTIKRWRREFRKIDRRDYFRSPGRSAVSRAINARATDDEGVTTS